MNVGRPRTGVVLAINPSHQTDLETEFWTNLASSIQTRGGLLVQIAARKIPEIEGALTFTIPAHLYHYEMDRRRQYGDAIVDLPRYVSTETVHVQAEWEHMRLEMREFDPRSALGFVHLMHFADRFVRLAKPDVVLTTNKIDHPLVAFRLAAKHHGVESLMVERSPFASIWVESEGLFAESDLWEWSEAGHLDGGDIARGADVRSELVGLPYGYRSDEAASHVAVDRSRPWVFLPFDNLLWTAWAQERNPQREIDNPAFPDPASAIEAVGAWAGERGLDVRIKPHPSCIVTDTLDLPPNVEIVDLDLVPALTGADVVACFNTKVAFLALALGRRPAVLSDNPAVVGGDAHYWREYDSPEATLDAALGAPDIDDFDSVDALFGALADRYFYETSSAEPRGTDGLAKRLVPGPVDEPPGHADIERLLLEAMEVPAAARTKPLVALDVSRIIDPSVFHSGIAVYQRAIVERLSHFRDEFDAYALIRLRDRILPETAPLFEAVFSALEGRVIIGTGRKPAARLAEVLGPLTSQDIYHSLHLPLPDPSFTADAVRVLTVHDVLHVRFPELNPSLHAPAIAKILESIDDSAHVFCDSAQTRRDLLHVTRTRADHTRVVTLGTEADAPPTVREGGIETVVALVQAEPRKNGAATVEAIVDVVSKRRKGSVRVELLASGGTAGEVERWLKELSADTEHFVVLDRPTDEQMAASLARCDVFVFGSSYEGFGLPPLEAVAHGATAVCVAGSSLIEVGSHAFVYALSSEASDLSAALEIALDDALRAERRLAETDVLAELSWDRAVADLVTAYADVAGWKDIHRHAPHSPKGET